jgi:hypothetical protein
MIFNNSRWGLGSSVKKKRLEELSMLQIIPRQGRAPNRVLSSHVVCKSPPEFIRICIRIRISGFDLASWLTGNNSFKILDGRDPRT